MKILITGINSFLGKAIATGLQREGHALFGTGQKTNNNETYTFYHWNLNSTPSQKWFQDIDLVIHLAWDIKVGAQSINIKGTQEFARVAKESGVKNQIFVSSCSAHENAKSEYGIGKKLCEEYFISNNLLVVRPGLVIGPGGGFMDIINTIKKSKFIPLLDGGNQVVPVIGLQDLVHFFCLITKNRPSNNVINLFSSQSTSFKILLKTVSDQLRKKNLFISINSMIVLKVISMLGILKIPTPISKEQIIGYRSNQNLNLKNTEIDELDLNKSLVEIIAQEVVFSPPSPQESMT